MSTQPLMLSPLSLTDAPIPSRPLLQEVQKTYGFIPNLFGVFSTSTALLEGYLSLDAAYGHATLTPLQRQVVLLAASVENDCSYCSAAHSTVLKNFMQASPELVAAIKEGHAIGDAKLDSLVALTKELVGKRGHLSARTATDFLAAGFDKGQVLEVLIGVALKTISNYTHHISQVPLDQVFQAEA